MCIEQTNDIPQANQIFGAFNSFEAGEGHVKSIKKILLPDRQRRGKLQIYGCDQRVTTTTGRIREKVVSGSNPRTRYPYMIDRLEDEIQDLRKKRGITVTFTNEGKEETLGHINRLELINGHVGVTCTHDGRIALGRNRMPAGYRVGDIHFFHAH